MHDWWYRLPACLRRLTGWKPIPLFLIREYQDPNCSNSAPVNLHPYILLIGTLEGSNQKRLDKSDDKT